VSKELKTYEFWYDEVYTYKAWIQAESQEQADELINQVEMADLDINALPGFTNKDKGYTLTIGMLKEETR
jgi:hypothetical protein